MLWTVVSQSLYQMVASLYPAYQSYKAIKTRDLKQVVPWLMYWIVMAAWQPVEFLVDLLIGSWMPFYYLIKLMFILWLIMPWTRGHILLYRYHVHPWLHRNEHVIDGALDEAIGRVRVAQERLRQQGFAILMESLFGFGSQTANVSTGRIQEVADLTDVDDYGNAATARVHQQTDIQDYDVDMNVQQPTHQQRQQDLQQDWQQAQQQVKQQRQQQQQPRKRSLRRIDNQPQVQQAKQNGKQHKQKLPSSSAVQEPVLLHAPGDEYDDELMEMLDANTYMTARPMKQ